MASKSNTTPIMLMPSPDLLLRILTTWGTFTSTDPAMMARPRPLLRRALKQGTADENNTLLIIQFGLPDYSLSKKLCSRK